MAINKSNTERSILLIIDSLKERNDLSSRLRVLGFKIEAASGGFHALNLVENKKFQLVILIEDMEDMAAHEIITHIRSIRDKKQLPILFMSKISDQAELIEMIELGANEYQVYSQNFNTTLQAIEKVCSSKK